ncbi:MAG TPA: IclR family transcriptional regulator C-terminal domain-containing protein [Acidimicrobiales bacterium]|nr:IclR family transcriptional regulator C-terminal domain-containing protein [Acidimicrobiales bacterium]
MGSTLGTVGVLDKAVSILDALEGGPASLAGLVASTGLPRATAHRRAAALEGHGLVARDGEGRWVLGARLAALAAAAAGARRGLVEVAAPVLADLRDRTGESAQLYVPDGDARVCVAAAESPHGLRTIVAVGARLPLDRGSAGRVLLGAGGPWVATVGEREAGVASVSAPVRAAGAVVAAVSVSGPIERTTRAPGRRYGAAVLDAARRIEAALA